MRKISKLLAVLVCALTLSTLSSCDELLFGDGDIIGTWESDTNFDDFIMFAPSQVKEKSKAFGDYDDIMVNAKVTFKTNGECRWRLEAYFESDPYTEIDLFDDTDFQCYYFYEDDYIDFSNRYEGGTDLGTYDIDFYGYNTMEISGKDVDMTFYRE